MNDITTDLTTKLVEVVSIKLTRKGFMLSAPISMLSFLRSGLTLIRSWLMVRLLSLHSSRKPRGCATWLVFILGQLSFFFLLNFY